MAGKVTVNADLCKSCELCVKACPKNIMAIDRTRLNAKGHNPAICTDSDKCIACAMCGIMCPDSAIEIENEKE